MNSLIWLLMRHFCSGSGHQSLSPNDSGSQSLDGSGIPTKCYVIPSGQMTCDFVNLDLMEIMWIPFPFTTSSGVVGNPFPRASLFNIYVWYYGKWNMNAILYMDADARPKIYCDMAWSQAIQKNDTINKNPTELTCTNVFTATHSQYITIGTCILYRT